MIAHIANVPFDLTRRATIISELLGSAPPIGALAAAIAIGFAKVTGHEVVPADLREKEAKRASELEALYGSDEWTWRR